MAFGQKILTGHPAQSPVGLQDSAATNLVSRKKTHKAQKEDKEKSVLALFHLNMEDMEAGSGFGVGRCQCMHSHASAEAERSSSVSA